LTEPAAGEGRGLTEPAAGAPGSGGGRGQGTAFARLARLLSAAITGWAVLAGLLLSALALMTAWSAVSNLLFARPYAPEIELTRYIVAIVIFMMLPYCQLVGANVTVDIFTDGMGPRTRAAMAAFASLFVIAFAALLLRQMSLGLESYRRFVEVTPVLRIPLWTAFPPILASLALLLVASVLTLADGVRMMRGQPSMLPREGGAE
jgi:TRAP-type C4-dicarboxylate transport system permease small subunit